MGSFTAFGRSVTATSPSLQGEQVVVTDSTGLYRVPQLPPGTYTLRFEKESYRPFARAGIEVAADLADDDPLLRQVIGRLLVGRTPRLGVFPAGAEHHPIREVRHPGVPLEERAGCSIRKARYSSSG